MSSRTTPEPSVSVQIYPGGEASNGKEENIPQMEAKERGFTTMVQRVHQQRQASTSALASVTPIRGAHRHADLENNNFPNNAGSYNGVAPLEGKPDHVHLSNRSPWLRAALLGANDGLVSVASLMAGVGAVREDAKSMAISGLAGLVAGAMSMAIGEYVSVYGQRDSEMADLEKERAEHAKGPEYAARELEELAQIYVERGLSYPLAKQVAVELSQGDVIKVHAREELGIDMDDLSNPLQAAVVSAIAFCVGGIIPLLAAAFIPHWRVRLPVLVAATSVGLVCIGSLGAWLGGARKLRAAVRVLVGGWLAMLITYAVLKLFGTAGLA